MDNVEFQLGGDAVVRGGCCGFAVSSRLGFVSLRSPDSIPYELRVDERADPVAGFRPSPLLEWFLDDQPFARLQEEEPGFGVWVHKAGWYRVDPQVPSITVQTSSDQFTREMRMWGLPATLCVLARGDHALHAAAVDVDGEAVVLAAPGRHGKTTLAAAFFRSGHRLLSEDMTYCSVSPAPLVWPGPALMRIRRDVYERIEFPGSSIVGEDAERVTFLIDPALRGTGAPVPLRAIVLLRPSDGPMRIEQVPGAEAIPDLWSLSFKLPVPADKGRCFRGVSDLVGMVPVWNLYRQMSFDNLYDVIDEIRRECLH